MRSIRCAPALLFLLALVPSWCHAEAAALRDLVDARVTEGLEAGEIAGAVVGVRQGGETLLLEGYGHADLEWDVAMPADAILEIGSVTKQFTAVAVLRLWEQGRLDLDADLTTYLPDYDTRGHDVPVRRLLDHTSGIQGYTEMPVFWEEISPRSLPREHLVERFEAEPFQFEPGASLIYNNSGYFLLGLIIEAVSGTSYAEFLEAEVFPRAGLEHTAYCTNGEIWARRARGYSVGEDGLERAAYLDHTWPYAAGSLCSTGSDLLAWLDALHGGEVLGEAAYELLVTPRSLGDGTVVRYAGGLVSFSGAGGEMIGHGGGINGFLSETRYYPEADATVVVLVNTTGPFAPRDLADAIGSGLTGIPGVEAVDHPGDLATYTGTFHGPVRGSNDAAVTITLGEDGRLVAAGPWPDEALDFVGDATFAKGDKRYRFTLEDGAPVRLVVDVLYGAYVLEVGEPVVQEDEAPLADAVEAWNERLRRAMSIGDIDAIVDLYADDAVIRWAYEGEAASGREEIEALWTLVLAEYPETETRARDRSVMALGEGAVAVRETLDQSWPAPDGSLNTEVQEGSSVFRMTPGGLVCVVDHTSRPLRWDSATQSAQVP